MDFLGQSMTMNVFSHEQMPMHGWKLDHDDFICKINFVLSRIWQRAAHVLKSWRGGRGAGGQYVYLVMRPH